MLVVPQSPNIERLMSELEHLAKFSDAVAPAVTRILYTEADLKARQFIKDLAREADFSLREDALGNTFIRWHGQNAELAAVATGSHIDAIPHSGRYDGTVGVLGGLEAMRSLKESGFMPERAIELILFTAEEPTRFGIGCLGSRALAGTLSPEAIRELKDDKGRNPDELRQTAGFAGRLEDVQLAPETYHSFVELHIEQGPLLEQKQIPIGIVTAIAAPATLNITIEGEGGHAGASLMENRKDALVAAAEVVLAAEGVAHGTGSKDSVATVGILDLHPRAVNSIPSRVFMTVDLRDTDLSRRDTMVETLLQTIRSIEQTRELHISTQTLNADPPASCAPDILAASKQAAKAAGLGTLEMVSRAYHDALFMARLCPTGMIFIPCKDGLSHRPDEYAKPEDIQAGVEVLARTLASLAS